MPAEELEALRKASEGLLYPSETDAPFEVIALPAAPSAREALRAADKLQGKVEEVSLDKFFGELSDSDDAGKFAKLKRTLVETLTDTKVYRVGTPHAHVYIIGKTKSGVIAGLRTMSVDT